VVDAQPSSPSLGGDARCWPPDVNPLVLVAMAHATMRALTCEVLKRGCGWRVAGVADDVAMLADAIARYHPDLVVLDTAVFPGRYMSALRRFPARRMVVVGPEPDDWYRAAALSGGAGGWVPRAGLSGPPSRRRRRRFRPPGRGELRSRPHRGSGSGTDGGICGA